MTFLEPEDRARLDRLRELDTTGLYASDEPTEGVDAKGALAVTVDALNRVRLVRVTDIGKVRDGDDFRAAFDAAYNHALHLKLARSDRPVISLDQARNALASRPRAEVRRPGASTMTAATGGAAPGAVARRERRVTGRRWIVVTGRSANRCVTVSLEPASARGRLALDQGWLSNAEPGNVANAVVEAFSAAYEKRSNHG